MQFDSYSETDNVAQITSILGLLFLTAGAAVLLFVVVTFAQFVNEPGSIYIIDFFAEFIHEDGAPVTLEIRGEEVQVMLDATARTILVIFVGGISIIALGSVLHACIGGGLQLLRFSRERAAKSAKS